MEVTQQQRCENGQRSEWTAEEKKMIAAITIPLVEMQKSYGRKIDAKLVMRGWQAILAPQYSGEQICYALVEYAKKSDDFPTPANLIAILNPQEPQVSEAEYIQACKMYEKNGYNQFSNEKDVIDRYKQQKNEKREEYKSASDEIQGIINQTAQVMIGE